MEVEQHKDRRSGDQTLEGLLEDDQLDDEKAKVIEHAWRGAEACHFLLLGQKQLHASKPYDALRCAVRLTEYDDIVDPLLAYSLLALAAAATRNYAICSKAFVKLESLPKQGRMKAHIESLATELFSAHPPK